MQKGGLKEEILKALRAQNPRTFGSEMAEIMISQEENAVMDFIRRRSPEFVKIPASRREAVRKCLYLANSDLRYMERLAPALRSMLQPLLLHDPVEINRRLEQFLRAPSLASLNLRPKSCLEPAQHLLDDVAELDAEKAMRLADKVRELIKGYPADQNGQNLDELQTWQSVTAAIPELFGHYANEFVKYDGTIKPVWLRDASYRISFWSNMPMRSVKILRMGRFLDEAPSFHSYRLEYGDTILCSLDTILKQIKSDDRAAAAATDFLNKQNPTFGVGLVKALLDNKPDSLIQFISKRAADLEKIPLDRHPEITYFCGIHFGSWLQLASVSPEWNQALRAFLPGHRIKIAESCDKLLAAKHLEDLEPRFNELDPAQGDPWFKWLNVISEMKMTDSAKAGQAFRHLLQLAENADSDEKEAQKESSSGYFYVNNYLSWAGKFPALFKLCLEAYASAKNPAEIKTRLSYSLSNMASRPVESCLLIETAGFLTDAGNFDATPTLDYVPQNSSGGFSREDLIMTLLIDGIKQGGDEIRKPVIKHLSEHKPKTFGSDFLLALLAEDGVTSVPAFLKTHHNDMSKLRAESRAPVLALLRQAWPEMPHSPDEKNE